MNWKGMGEIRMIRPILFNTEMVTAVLEGRKTATRRLIKFPKNNFTGEVPRADNIKVYKNTLFEKKISFLEEPHYSFDVRPPCRLGDILYVRETWGISNLDSDDNTAYIVYKASKNEKNEGCRAVKFSDNKFEQLYDSMAENSPDWRPSIHMPKEVARIWLKVTDVRVERLQDITHIDIIMEGFVPEYLDAHSGEKTRDDFVKLWDSTVPKKKLSICGWKANPWVWVIEFKRIEKPEGWCV